MRRRRETGYPIRMKTKAPFLAVALSAVFAAAPAGAQTALESAYGRAAGLFLHLEPSGMASVIGTAVSEGPAAALAFERGYRGAQIGGYYPDAKPIPFKDTKNIVPMNESLWSTVDLMADFRKNKTAEQKAILVVVKTEFCCTNTYRPCAVTTAALEKRSTPELKKFRIYGAWVKNPKADQSVAAKTGKAAWDAKVIKEYGFQQGPGATLVFIHPTSATHVRTDAGLLKLDMSDFEANKGAAPLLAAKIAEVLKAFGN